MEELIYVVIAACLAGVMWGLQEIAKDHRERLSKIKPRITEILTARINSLDKGQDCVGIFQIKDEELEEISKYLPIIKSIKLKRTIKEYKKANTWEIVKGCYKPTNPIHLLNTYKVIYEILK